MKKILALLVSLTLFISLFASISLADTSVEDIIKQAEQMSNEELYKKAIEESNGKVLYGIGNSSRGKTAGASFIEMLKGIDPNYSGTLEWSQPKNNSIFTTLEADINSAKHVYALTLIQDGNQIQSKMIETGNLLNYIPLDWKNAEGVDVEDAGKPLTLQTLNKVFMFNNTGSAEYKNCWDFVYKGVSPLYMGLNSELVGKNFLYMLTHEKYANYLKDAFDKLPQEKQDYFKPTIEELKKDAQELGLEAENANYALAWIKLWCLGFSEETDDGPICSAIVAKSAVDQSALIVYSKLRSVEESASSSVNNVTVAAYQDDYVGIGGYGYRHYLQIPKTSPLPWTACAFISYMVTSKDGFAAWGKDMGGYSPNPAVMQDHSQDGYVDGKDTYPAKNDRGYEWWVSADGGQLVVEDPEYCAEVSFGLDEWIDLTSNSK